MPTMLTNLVIDRVDLVDEGANSAAFIELYKRKERGDEMTLEQILKGLPEEQATVIQAELDKRATELSDAVEKSTALETTITELHTQVTTANDGFAKAKSELDELKKALLCEECGGEIDKSGVCKACGVTREKSSFDEKETLKSAPKELQELFKTMQTQKEAAEEALRKSKEAEQHSEAVAKAATLKSLPIEQDKLVDLIKGGSEELLGALTAINEAIGDTVLGEVGKSKGSNVNATADDAWGKIEEMAKARATADGVTVQKAVTLVIDENPDLYKEYLKGGAN